jgi:hypothetical protein
VKHVARVPAVSKSYEDLREDQLFDRNDEDPPAQDLDLPRVSEPGFLHKDGSVVVAVDDVREEGTFSRLGEPAWVLDLRLESSSLESFEDPRHVLLGDEQVKVLRIAPDARIGIQGDGATKHVADVSSLQCVEGFAIDLVSFGTKVGLSDH